MNREKLVESLEKQARITSLNRKQLAARLGISTNYIYRIKDGSRNPGVKFMRAIRREFPVLKEITYLYEDSLVANTECRVVRISGGKVISTAGASINPNPAPRSFAALRMTGEEENDPSTGSG